MSFFRSPCDAIFTVPQNWSHGRTVTWGSSYSNRNVWLTYSLSLLRFVWSCKRHKSKHPKANYLHLPLMAHGPLRMLIADFDILARSPHVSSDGTGDSLLLPPP